MTNTQSNNQSEPQWKQPNFTDESKPEASFTEEAVSVGSVMIPATATPPPSVAETVCSTLAGVIWPVMIVAAIMGAVSWWLGILAAIAVSIVFGSVQEHLKSHRKALGKTRVIPPDELNGLR